jgi:hypothetical protein
MLVFAAPGRAEDDTLTADAGAVATVTDNAGAITPTPDESSATPPAEGTDTTAPSDSTSGSTTDPAPAPPTETVPPPTETVPPPTETVPPPTETVPPPTETVPPPTETVPPPTETVPPPTETVPPPSTPLGSPHDHLGFSGPSPDGVPIASPRPVSDALVTVVFGSPRSSAPSVDDPPDRRSGGATHSRGAPAQPPLPSDSPRPSAPSAPAGSGGAPGGGFFFSGFAALVAAVCFGLTRRSTKRLIISVAEWEPVAFVSLPERPG